MRPLLLGLVAATILAGCANQQNYELQAEAQRTIPVCLSEKECEAMWASARRWVLDNAGFKIQNYGSDYFDTYNPTQASPRLAAQVSKEPFGNGSYRIIAKLWCDNMFGCQPDKWQALISFNSAVNSAKIQ